MGDNGGGVLSLTGYTNSEPDTERPNSLLAELGVSYVQPLLPDSDNMTVSSFAKHPLTRGLHAVVFYGGYGVAHTAPASEIALANSLTPVALAATHGAGRVYLWGDEWVSYTQEWSAPGTQRFWADAIAWLSHED